VLEIYESSTWLKLRDHAEEMKALHLRDLIQDAARCDALTAEYAGITLDYSRQNITTTTMVSPSVLSPSVLTAYLLLIGFALRSGRCRWS
jgi:hypothetical protein